MWLVQNAPGANSCNINLIWSCQICAIFLMKHLENIDSIDRGKDSKRNKKKQYKKLCRRIISAETHVQKKSN